MVVLLIFIGISLLLQLVAAFMALRLIVATGKNLAWVLIAIAVFLMVARRLVTLYQLLTGVPAQTMDLIESGTTLLISAFMLAGIAWIGPIFTAIRASEQVLRENEERFHSLYENATIGMYRTTPNGLISMANPALLGMLGYQSFEELAQRDLSREGYEPEYPRQDFQRRIEQQGKIYGFESAWKRKDGSTIFVRESAHLVKDEHGQPLYYEGTVEDITERKQAEAALKISEERYRGLVENMNEVVMEIDAQGNYCYVSPNYETLAGYSLEEELADSAFAHVHPEDRPLLLQKLGKALDSAQSMIYRVQYKSGKWLWIETFGKPYRTEDGSLRVISVARDITERKQAEEALRASEENLHALLNAILESVLLIKTDGTVIAINPTTARRLHSTVEQMVGQSVYAFLPPDVSEHRKKYVAQVIATRQPVWFEDERFERTILNSIMPVLDTDGQIERLAIFGFDNTERKEAEEILKESEKRFATIFHANPAAIAITQLDSSQLVDVNAAWLEVTGYMQAEVMGHTATELNLWFNTGQRAHLLEMVRAHGRARGEMQLRRKSGEVRDLLMSAEIIELTGNPHLLTMAQDITEIKQTGKALKEYNTRLETAVEARTSELREAQEQLIRQEKLAVLGQLAGGVGHELRNPLAVILNAVYYLKLVQPEANDKIRQYHGMIEYEAHTAEKIITDLLDFARIKSVDREPVAVPELVRRVLERFPAPAPVSVTLDFPPDLPKVFVDPRQVEQVLGNLTVNACQAMPSGGTLSVMSKQLSVEGVAWVRIAVKDTGSGITPENMEKLFEPLFTTKAKGIGLGLAVSQKLIEANGGRIGVESEVGVGSTFTVWLPVKS